MFTGFTFKGIHTNEFEIISKTTARPVMPAQKRHEVNASNIDGIYDFSTANFNSRPFYESRIFESEIIFKADNIHMLQNKISKVALWLTGSGKLIFDDMPTVIWYGQVVTQIDYNLLLNGIASSVKVAFKVNPWSDNEFGTDGPVLDSNIVLDSDIPLDLSSMFLFTLSNGTNNITVRNLGTWYVRPVFTFTGSASSIQIDLGDYTLEYSSSFTSLVVDCEKQCVSSKGTVLNKNAKGNFLELAPGDNVITITVTSSSTISLLVSYTPKFIYNSTWEE